MPPDQGDAQDREAQARRDSDTEVPSPPERRSCRRHEKRESPGPTGWFSVSKPAIDRTALDLRTGMRELFRQLAHPGEKHPIFLAQMTAVGAILQVSRDSARLSRRQEPFEVI
jgi:hypothetical protein